MFSIINDFKFLEELNKHTRKHFYYDYINCLYQFYLFTYSSNIRGMPLHNAVYVYKGYMANNLVDI